MLLFYKEIKPCSWRIFVGRVDILGHINMYFIKNQIQKYFIFFLGGCVLTWMSLYRVCAMYLYSLSPLCRFIPPKKEWLKNEIKFFWLYKDVETRPRHPIMGKTECRHFSNQPEGGIFRLKREPRGWKLHNQFRLFTYLLLNLPIFCWVLNASQHLCTLASKFHNSTLLIPLYAGNEPTIEHARGREGFRMKNLKSF